MNKIYNIIPGNLINDKFIVSKILTLIDSVEFNKWIEINENVYLLKHFWQNDEFYVMYLDPGGLIYKLYITCCDDILSFMKKRINYKYGEGVDITICTKEMNNAVICNHDGQVFILKNME